MTIRLRCAVLCFACVFIWQRSFAVDTTEVALGGNARMLALGGSPVNYYLLDYTNIFINPAYLKKYTNLAMIELGSGFGNGSGFTANNQQFGSTLTLGDMTFGLVVGRREGPMFVENSYGYQSGGSFSACDYMKSALDTYLQNLLVQSSLEPLTPLQVLTAFKIGEISVGFALYQSSWSRNDDGTGSVSLGRTCSATLSQYGIKGGVLYPLNSTMLIDLAGCLRLNRASADYSNKNTGAPLAASSFSANGYEMSVTGRMFYELTPSMSLVPLARVEMFFYEPEVSSTPLSNFLLPFPNSYSKWEYELGAGIQSRWERGIAVVGVSVQYISLKNDAVNNVGLIPQTTKYNRTWFDLPKINAGVEFSITPWLIGRAGYTKRISTQRTHVEAPSPAPPTESVISLEPGFLPSFGLAPADQTLSLGLGIFVDRFTFNAYLAEQVVGTGTYLLSGIEQSLFGVVSLSYQY
jgi:hypothetical protein